MWNSKGRKMKVRITAISETTRMTPEMKPETVVITTYMVGDYGPFSIAIPKEEFTAERVKDLIREESEEIRKLAEMGTI